MLRYMRQDKESLEMEEVTRDQVKKQLSKYYAELTHIMIDLEEGCPIHTMWAIYSCEEGS
jgi:hypothetical protein